jgi:hypothetical protein
MKKITKILLTALLAGVTSIAYSQCPNNNYQYGSTNADIACGVPITTTTCLFGGEYRYFYNMQAGSSYTFSTCGDYSFDTQITVYDAVTGAYLAYNDDYCGLQSQVTFTSSGNPVRVLIDRYYCGNQSACMTLKITRNSGCAAAVDPCNSITGLSCGVTSYATLSGSGSWLPGGPWGTPGEEVVYSFTAPYTGSFPISVTNSGYYVDLFYKFSSCGPSGWTYVDDIYSSYNGVISLTAGQTILLCIDDENTSTSYTSINVSCPPPAADPCSSITPITSCGNSESFSLSGSGAWNGLGGPWSTPGEEAVFSYTAPVTGAYPITVTNSGYYVDLLYKASSCGSTGWTYVSDIYTNETNTVNLVGGVTYLFLIDDENTSASSGTINIACPCIPPPGGIDASITVTSNTVYSSTTLGACNDCSFRSSNDRVLEMEITCAGTYTMSMCGGASWDTYLYLSTAPCGGSIIALNDDNCGLQSSITTYLNIGTYYVTVEGWSASSQGAFDLNITKQCNMTLSLDPDVANCGYNISCNGANDGTVSSLVGNSCGALSYSWSDGSTDPTLVGASAGLNSLSVSDDFGCSANASVTLTEPDPLVVDAGSDQTVFYGYTPASCAELAGTAVGGCPSYTYSWSDGSTSNLTTVCPSVSTDYELTVEDQNGCSSSDVVHICVIDVTCFAGNSSNQKVEVCHTPRGNPGNSHTICIDESAVAAHLAHGCSLGACDEQGDCASPSFRAEFDIDHGFDLQAIGSIEQYPNPVEQISTFIVEIANDANVNLTIMNIRGEKISTIFNGKMIGGKANKFTNDLSNLQSGVYYIYLEHPEGLLKQKFVILK